MTHHVEAQPPMSVWRRVRWEVGMRETSVDARPLALVLFGIAALLVAQSLLSLALTGYPGFVQRPFSTAAGITFVVGLPAVLIIGGLVALRLPHRLLWLCGFPMLLVGVALQTVATIGTADGSSGGLFVLLVILFLAGYYLRPAGAWVACVLTIASLVLNAIVLSGPQEAFRNLVVGTAISVTATIMLIRARNAQEDLMRRYRDEARLDALTGARSRLAMQEWAQRELGPVQPTAPGDGLEIGPGADTASGTGLLLVDLDHFKLLNDVHGHLVGDAMLRHVAQRMSLCAQPRDLVGRLGGDEFGLLLARVQRSDVEARARALELDLSQHPLPLDVGPPVPVRVSIGVGYLPPGVHRPEDLIAAADGDLYEAKRRREAAAGGRCGYRRLDRNLRRGAVGRD